MEADSVAKMSFFKKLKMVTHYLFVCSPLCKHLLMV